MFKKSLSAVLPEPIRQSVKGSLHTASWPIRKTAAAFYHRFQADRPSQWPAFVQDEFKINFRDIRIDLINKTDHLSGDIVECGVWKGNSLVSMALRLHELGSPRKIHGFDSFEGLPDPTNEDISKTPKPGKPDLQDNSQFIRKSRFNNTSMDYIYERLKSFGLESSVTLYKGWFQDTLPSFSVPHLSFVHLDCDIYESYKFCLPILYPRVQEGGYMLFDEYEKWAYPGAKKAIDEFFSDKPEKVTPCDKGRAFVQKTGGTSR